MKIKDLMEKLSKMNPEAQLVVEGLEDEVETTEEVVETPEEPKSLWDKEIADDEYADRQAKGFHDVIKAAHDNKLGDTGLINNPGADIHSEPAGIYYDENKNNATTKKKLKLIAKWKWIEAGMPPNFGGHIDDEIELPKFEEYRQKYNAWKEENGWNQKEDVLDNILGIDYDFDDVAEEDENKEEIDECGSACGKMNEEAKKCEKCGKEPCECEKELEECGGACAKPVTEEAKEPTEESAEAIEARLNEQMKTDYQKELDEISDFLF